MHHPASSEHYQALDEFFRRLPADVGHHWAAVKADLQMIQSAHVPQEWQNAILRASEALKPHNRALAKDLEALLLVLK